MQTNFYDVPVYRLPEDRYNSEMDAHIEQAMYPPGKPWSEETRALHKREPSLRIAFHDHLWRSYGGMWRYNEIIGYIRLHFLGSQIRGEYASAVRRRVVRTRTKIFEYRTHKIATEVDIPRDANSDDILLLLRKYLERCKQELPKRHIDMRMFDTLAPYVDWHGLYSGHLERLRQRLTPHD
jgi:hypothetical protein